MQLLLPYGTVQMINFASVLFPLEVCVCVKILLVLRHYTLRAPT